MAKDKEEGVVLVKHTAEYQQKRKSRKKAAKQHKKVSAMPSVVKAKTHKKKTGGGKESKQKKLKHKHKKKTKEPSPSPAGEQPASAPKVKKVPHRSAKKKTTEMKEGAVRPAQLANRKSMEMVQGRKEMKEPRPWPGMRPRPSQTAVQPRKSQTAMPPSDEKQKESTPPTARDNSEQMVCRGAEPRDWFRYTVEKDPFSAGHGQGAHSRGGLPRPPAGYPGLSLQYSSCCCSSLGRGCPSRRLPGGCPSSSSSSSEGTCFCRLSEDGPLPVGQRLQSPSAAYPRLCSKSRNGSKLTAAGGSCPTATAATGSPATGTD